MANALGRPNSKSHQLFEIELKNLAQKSADPSVIAGCWVDFTDPRREAICIPVPESASPTPDSLMKVASSNASPAVRAAALLDYNSSVKLKKASEADGRVLLRRPEPSGPDVLMKKLDQAGVNARVKADTLLQYARMHAPRRK
jgi:hypothetical protein